MGVPRTKDMGHLPQNINICKFLQEFKRLSELWLLKFRSWILWKSRKRVMLNQNHRKLQFDVRLFKPHCVKSVCIRSNSGLYFPAFGVITERYSMSFHIQSKRKKIQTRITLNTDPFYAVPCINHFQVTCCHFVR